MQDSAELFDGLSLNWPLEQLSGVQPACVRAALKLGAVADLIMPSTFGVLLAVERE